MATQFIIFFALLVTGYLCKKTGIIDDGMNHSINKFIIHVAYPCLILNRIGSLEMEKGIFGNFLITLLVSGGFLMFYSLFAFWYVKFTGFPEEDTGVAEFSIISPNNGFIGFPIAVTFFGEYGLLYMVACNLALNIMFFSYGIHLMTRTGESGKPTIKGVLSSVVRLCINPMIGSAVLGLIICGYGIIIPETIKTYLELVGGIATPMAMIFIGSTLAGSSLLKILKNRLIIKIAVSKLFILPALTLVIVFFLPLDPIVKCICVISCALPCATTVPMFAEQYKKNKSISSEALFLSTVISFATVPAVISIVNTIL